MNKKGFTLIELLAVIIILGILMIIAIPSVTKYISDSRKSAYIDTAKEIIGGARNLVNEGKLEMYDTDTTYYIDTECVKTENASKSPYGEFTKAYVVVTYDGKGYEYYWTSVDDAGQGIQKITKIDNLDTDLIESDLTSNDIHNDYGIDGRNKYMIINKSCNCEKSDTYSVTDSIDGNTGNVISTAANELKNLNSLEELDNIFRYTGSNPDNYVLFNNGQVWRIIGIYGNNLKIISTIALTDMKYNSYSSSTNEWEGSLLQRYLNNDYYNTLSSEAKNIIEVGTWHVGASTGAINANRSYEYEKEKIYNDKVGLITSYEYQYAASGECPTLRGDNYNSGCIEQDWLYMNSENRTWTISPYTAWDNYSLFILPNGNVDYNFVNYLGVAYPVVYLKSSVKIISGSGTSGDPYVLG